MNKKEELKLDVEALKNSIKKIEKRVDAIEDDKPEHPELVPGELVKCWDGDFINGSYNVREFVKLEKVDGRDYPYFVKPDESGKLDEVYEHAEPLTDSSQTKRGLWATMNPTCYKVQKVDVWHKRPSRRESYDYIGEGWENCYDPNTFLTLTGLTIEPGQCLEF